MSVAAASKQRTVAGVTVDVNDEGFFVTPEQWTEAMVPELARDEGITELTVSNCEVLRYIRS